MRARQHAKRHLLNAVPADDTRYASFTLRPVDQLAAFHPEACDQQVRSIEIAQLASYPLLLLEPGANMIGDVFKRAPFPPRETTLQAEAMTGASAS